MVPLARWGTAHRGAPDNGQKDIQESSSSTYTPPLYIPTGSADGKSCRASCCTGAGEQNFSKLPPKFSYLKYSISALDNAKQQQ